MCTPMSQCDVIPKLITIVSSLYTCFPLFVLFFTVTTLRQRSAIVNFHRPTPRHTYPTSPTQILHLNELPTIIGYPNSTLIIHYIDIKHFPQSTRSGADVERRAGFSENIHYKYHCPNV